MSATGYSGVELAAAAAAAAQAPVPDRNQPWLRLRDGAIDVLGTPAGAGPADDPVSWAARLGGGAGLFNVRLALAVRGRPALVRLRPYRDEPELLARLHPGPVRPAGPAERELFAALPHCSVGAGPVVPTPVPPEVRRRLIDAARAEHGWLELIVGHAAVAAFTEIEASARRVLDRDPNRATPELDTEPDPTPHGSNGSAPHGAGGSAPHGPDGVPGHEPVIAVLGSPLDTPVDQVRAGQALQRLLLTAGAAGLVASLRTGVIAVPSAREQLRLALGRSGRPQMVLRIGHRAAEQGGPPAPSAADRPPVPDSGDRASAPSVADRAFVPDAGDRRSREEGSKVPGRSGPPALPRMVVSGVEWR